MNKVLGGFLSLAIIHTGPVHNDFHPGNIMKNSAGDPRVIDFDCFHSFGIQAIDSLYYQSEKHAKKRNSSWLDILEDYSGKDVAGAGHHIDWQGEARTLAFLTFLNVIGQEDRLYGMEYPEQTVLKMYESLCLKN